MTSKLPPAQGRPIRVVPMRGASGLVAPVPGQGWYNDTNGEIGDICAWQNKKLGAYEVQLLWSNRAQACV